MTILSLITIGFSQIMAREQRQALDRQLSSQAFYAAESGVNDAIQNITGFNTTTCLPYSISTDNSVENTCITTTSDVPDLRFDQISTDQNNPKVFPIRTSPSPPSTIMITWRPTTTTTPANFRAANDISFPNQAGWLRNTGALKVYLIPFTNGQRREQLINSTASIILVPNDSPVAPPAITTVGYSSFSGANFGLTQGVACNSSTVSCTAYLDLGSLPAGYTDLYMVLSSLYQPNAVVIDADGGGTTLSFSGVQVIIDSTGKTTDVVRRIQVRQSLIDGFTMSAGALETTFPSGSICKLITASPTGTTDTATPACSL